MEPTIKDGDRVIVDTVVYRGAGDIVVAQCGNVNVVKRLAVEGDDIVLKSDNPAHKPFSPVKYAAFTIIGAVVAIIRMGVPD